MDQRYHHMWKGLGLGLFFTMSAALWHEGCNQWIAKVMASKNEWKEDNQLEQDLFSLKDIL